MRPRQIEEFEKRYLKPDPPKMEIGDTVKVHHKIIEGEKERIQVFQGIVIRMQGAGLNRSFTIRKVSFSVGVEKTYPFHSPRVAKVEVIKQARVRRAKLYYMRDLSGKSARLKQRRFVKSEAAAKKKENAEA